MKLVDERIEEEHVLYSDEEANDDDDAQSDDTEGYSSEEANNDDSQTGRDDDIGTMVIEPINSFATTKKPTRGLTRLPKLRTEYANSSGVRLAVEFDNLGRFTGQNRSNFASFLGDVVREIVGLRHLSWREVTKELRDKLWEQITKYFEIEACHKPSVMNQLGHLLRDFRRKMYAKYIMPNIGKPLKLKVIPKGHRTMIRKEDWDRFVEYTQSEQFQNKSASSKGARAKNVFDHHMGRGGYTYLREKLVKKKEIEPDEIPGRALMLMKGREDKDGAYNNAPPSWYFV